MYGDNDRKPIQHFRNKRQVLKLLLRWKPRLQSGIPLVKSEPLLTEVKFKMMKIDWCLDPCQKFELYNKLFRQMMVPDD